MSAYPDSAIDAALRSAMYCYDEKQRRKAVRVRAKMIAIRDAAGPRVGAKPSRDDLHLALVLRAKDLLGISDPNGFYL